MTIYFQANPVAFFDSRVRTAPPGAVEISEELHGQLMLAQAQGQRIGVGPDGMPHAVEGDYTQPALTAAAAWQIKAVLAARPAPKGKTQLDLMDAAMVAGKGADLDGKVLWLGWTGSSTFGRGGPVAARLGTLLDMTDAEIDALFVEASQMVA